MKPESEMSVTREWKLRFNIAKGNARQNVARTTWVDCGPREKPFLTLKTPDGKFCLSLSATVLPFREPWQRCEPWQR